MWPTYRKHIKMNIPLNICRNKPDNKPGRTIIVQEPLSSNYLTNSAKIAISSSGTIFIEKENIHESINLYEILKKKNIKCKYAYYRCFFVINNAKLLEQYNYNTIKENIIHVIKISYPELQFIHLKIFSKNKKIMNTGYLVVDRISDFKNIIGCKFHFSIHCNNFSVKIKKFMNKKNLISNYIEK